MNLEKINICHRVDLYLNNEGFKFTNSLYPPDKSDLQNWKHWKRTWKLYEKDGIKEKVYTFLNSLPDRFKSENFYQQLNFQE